LSATAKLRLIKRDTSGNLVDIFQSMFFGKCLENHKSCLRKKDAKHSAALLR
jgi:hypothetical protein